MVDRVEGRLFGEGSSRSEPATLVLHPQEVLEIRCASGSRLYTKAEYSVEPPLGSLDRVVHLKGGEGESRFETPDRDAFRGVEKQLSSGKAWHVVAWMEDHWKGTLACLAGVAGFTLVFFIWVLPALAWRVAEDMPQSWRRAMTEQSIDMMQKMSVLSESGLSIDEHERVQEIFYEAIEVASARDEIFDYELRIFDGGRMGANAFAFPSGLVVATDEFVKLCESNEQILAVFLHEITHVEQQHGIRSLVQQGGVFVVMSILVGDVSSAISLAEGLPALLMNSQYSQRFEMESDSFAATALEKAGIGAAPMKEVLILLHKDAPEVPLAAYLSTHPSLQERIANIDALSGSRL